ncbi:hypothetical protein [Ekhidna sp.]|uniref:hypothetical protein n=1 Tax=Ekhidna sp. TaxID=2608089 RepID=UPI003C7976E0
MKHKLDDIDKKEVFKVPEGYFEGLPMRIQKRVDSEKPVTRQQFTPKWGLALAASIALVVTFVFVLYNNGPSPEDMLAEISQDELVAYLELMELDEYEIASAFDEDMEIFDKEDANILDGIDLEEDAIDDVLLEYDLEDEYL